MAALSTGAPVSVPSSGVASQVIASPRVVSDPGRVSVVCPPISTPPRNQRKAVEASVEFHRNIRFIQHGINLGVGKYF